MSQRKPQENSDEEATSRGKERPLPTIRKMETAKKVAKRTKPADEKFVIGNTNTVHRGFWLGFCDFTRKNGTVDLEMLVKEFSGRQIGGRPIKAARVARYVRYAVNNGQFKVAK
jgi:hypothetical protein